MKATSMTTLLNKIERRLGTQALKLPDYLKKEKWAEIIQEDSLTTFSRFFPHKILYIIDTQRDKGKDGYYYIDEDRFPGDVTILGVRDLTLQTLARTTDINNGSYDSIYTHFGYDDMAMQQMNADINSLFNSGIYIEYEYPNRIKVEGVTGINLVKHLPKIEVELLIKHADNLSTVSPTMMEEFERLAIIDIKLFLYNSLKYYQNIETVFANIDMKIDDWQSAEGDRESLVEEYKEKYISAANKNQPIMYTV